MSDIVLHICCAPCALYPFKQLKKEGFNITGFFYNPNIHPYKEYEKRRDCVKNYLFELDIHFSNKYPLEEYLVSALNNMGTRCYRCYVMRLEESARFAAGMKISAITTTLLYSKYQKHDWIKEAGKKIESQYNIEFIYRDFRDGWKWGVGYSRFLDMYRQPYCGCIFSEKERYLKKEKNESLQTIRR